jgi:hypothetical protein
MNTRSRLSIYVAFFLKAVFSALVIMFGCMALGELTYDAKLFSGFLKRPSLWVGILEETFIATLLMTALGACILHRFRFSSRRVFIRVSAFVFCLLGLILIALYSHFYWTRDWHITAMAPGLIFGWFLPGLLTVISFVSFSLHLRQPEQENAICDAVNLARIPHS